MWGSIPLQARGFMAQTAYTTQRVTAQTRAKAYERLCVLLTHIPHYTGVDLVSIVRNPDNSITITLTNPVPPEQVDHLGLT